MTRRSVFSAGRSADRGHSWFEGTAADVVTSLLAVSDVESFDEIAAGGLLFEHYNAEAQIELPVLGESPLSFFADVGFGATRMRSHEPGQLAGSRESYVYGTYLSGMSGISIRYQVTAGIRAYVGARYFGYVNDADDLHVDQVADPSRSLDSSSWTFPFIFGFQISFK